MYFTTDYIGYGEDGLVPIWRLVPNSYIGLKQKMETALKAYSDKVSNENISNSDDHIYYSLTKKSRSDAVYKITDSGRFNQQYDTIFPTNSLGVAYSNGYDKVRLHIRLTAKEFYDGTQYIFIYKDKSETAELLATISFEHKPGGIDYSYKTYNFIVHDLDLDDIKSSFVVRYGAEGWGEDTWYNKDLYVGYTVYKS